MDNSALAIAALQQQVAQSPNLQHDIVGKLPASSIVDATGTRVKPSMANNPLEENHVGVQETSPSLSASQETRSRETESQENNNPTAQSTSSNNSQSTADGHDAASTPPTSDGFSSQSTNQDGPLSQLSQLAAAQPPLASSTPDARPVLAITPSAGQKRTADGQVKAGSNSPPTPSGPVARGHSRNTSTVSNASSVTSRIGELSSELRTRLSYAMIKVNHGWQSNSIDEVESLASQAGSPTSSTSTIQGRRSLLTSPRTAIANIQGQSQNNASASRDFDLYSRTDQPSRTYESFWRDHSANTPTVHRHSHHSHRTSPPNHHAKHTLAPPADIRPAPSSRRSDPKYSKPPAIPGSSSFNNNSTPRTPVTRPGDYIHKIANQSPAQKTIQEQDAIETLLFMSSPGNSGNMGPGMLASAAQTHRGHISPPQGSPLRAEFGGQLQVPKSIGGTTGRVQRRVGFVNGNGERLGEGKGTGEKRRQAIEKLLDEMGGEESDDEAVELVIGGGAGKRVAGRV